MMYKVKLFILLPLFLYSLSSIAQTTLPTKFVELSVCTNSYKGDLSHSYSQWANGIQVGLLFNKKKIINGHLNLFIGTAIAQNPNYFFDNGANPQPTPNNFAKIQMIALNYDLHINLYKKHNLIVYFYQGIGLMRFNPKDADNNNLANQISTRAPNESYSNTTVMLPTGIGALYVFKPGIGVGFQGGWLNTRTDYLDNISQWGDMKHLDNILTYRMTFYIPISAALLNKLNTTNKTAKPFPK